MPSPAFQSRDIYDLALTGTVVDALRSLTASHELTSFMQVVTREMGFHYYALVHHTDLRKCRPDRVDLKNYPAVVMDRLLTEQRYRRDPVIRGCIFADSAFLWSELPRLIRLTKQDRASLEFGLKAGLNEGITVPYVRLGDCMGSCTFAGTGQPETAARFLGAAQMIGVFAFQAARRLQIGDIAQAADPLRLHPRPRDCIILAGRGYSNKEIARALSLAPKTVDGYLAEARRLFDAHDRAELVVSAVLAGEIGLDELRPHQPG